MRGIRTQEELRWWEEGQRKAKPARPHKMVVLKLAHCGVPMLMQSIKAPRQFPRKKPIGCPRAPIAPPQGFTGASSSHQEEARQGVLDGAWKEVTECMEFELCGVNDLFKEGKPDARWMGRGGELKLVSRQVFPRRAAGALGRMKQKQYAYVWCQLRLQGVKALADKRKAHGALNEAQMAQWHALIRKFCSPSSLARYDAEDFILDKVCAELQAVYSRPEEAIEVLDSTMSHVNQKVDGQRQEDETAARNSWKVWLKKQMQGGSASGAAHGFVKRVEADPDVLIKCASGASAAPQDVVQADLEEWNKVWQALKEKEAAPWRRADLKAGEAPLRKITVADLRKVARSFKERTGIGIDGIAPRQLDMAIRRIIAAYN